MSKPNPRRQNGHRRNKNRARIKARGDACYLCGRPIDYSRTSVHDPFSWVVDEVIPVSRWQEFGYHSARAVAEDFSNLRAAHRICNQRKSNKTIEELRCKPKPRKRAFVAPDGEW